MLKLILRKIHKYLHGNCEELIDSKNEVINRQHEAMRVMAEDFYRKCPEMRQVACDPRALVMRYEGYTMQGRRPELPTARVRCVGCGDIFTERQAKYCFACCGKD